METKLCMKAFVAGYKLLRETSIPNKINGLLSIAKPAHDGNLASNKQDLQRFLLKVLQKQPETPLNNSGSVKLLQDEQGRVMINIFTKWGVISLPENDTLDLIQSVYKQMTINFEDAHKLQNYLDDDDLHSVSSLRNDAQDVRNQKLQKELNEAYKQINTLKKTNKRLFNENKKLKEDQKQEQGPAMNNQQAQNLYYEERSNKLQAENFAFRKREMKRERIQGQIRGLEFERRDLERHIECCNSTIEERKQYWAQYKTSDARTRCKSDVDHWEMKKREREAKLQSIIDRINVLQKEALKD